MADIFLILHNLEAIEDLNTSSLDLKWGGDVAGPKVVRA